MESEAAGGPVVRLITDISGESAGQGGPYTAALLEDEANPLIVAMGLGGPEEGLPRSGFASWFDRARRVQHGVRAVEDEAVMRLQAERRICCDIALTSNECLKVVPSVAAHPLRRFLSTGVSMSELWELNLNGLRFGLADAALRRRLLRSFRDEAGTLDPALRG